MFPSRAAFRPSYRPPAKASSRARPGKRTIDATINKKWGRLVGDPDLCLNLSDSLTTELSHADSAGVKPSRALAGAFPTTQKRAAGEGGSSLNREASK
jgi:hypothetical protein